MIFPKATFDSLEEIPDKYEGNPRDEFETVNGKWQLKADAIPGAADLFNPGIAANRDRALDQIKAKDVTIGTLNTKVRDLEQSNTLPPGSVVLSQEDAKTWAKVTALVTKAGSIKEIETAVTEFPALKAKIGQEESNKTLAVMAKELGLNPDVLTDWKNHPDEGKGLTFFVKDVLIDDPKKPGTKIPAKQGFAKVETEVNGKVEVSETPLVDIAKTKLPLWKFTALTTTSGAPDDKGGSNGVGGAGNGVGQPVIAGVQLPNMGSAQVVTHDKGGKKLGDKFQAERDAVPSPFAVPTAAQ